MGLSTLARFVIIFVAAAELCGQSDGGVGATSRATLEKSTLPKLGTWLRNLKMVTLTPKIKGGTPCPVGRFPYMVSIRNRVSLIHICGGILLNKYWILTAAHCLGDAGQNPVVVAGTNLLDHVGQGEELLVTRSILHPGFTGNASGGNDIALMQLLNPTTKVNTFANLPDEDTKYNIGHQLLAIGWGTDGNEIQGSLDCSQALQVVSQDRCQQLWSATESSPFITGSMVCAFSETSDTCKGDSGGPLIDAQSPEGDFSKGRPNFDIIGGLTSFGAKCNDNPSIPGVYTFVPKFREWVQQTMEGNGKPPQQVIIGLKDQVSPSPFAKPPMSDEAEVLEFLQSMD